MMTNMKYALTAALVAGGFALLGPATGVAQFKPGSTIVKGNLKGNVNFIDVYQKESYSKVVKRELSKNETYVITLTAKGFDPILRLETAKGVVLQTNDDAQGLGRNSRITFTPSKTAVYRMVVTSYKPNTDGDFAVRIDRKIKRDPFATKVTKFVGYGTIPTDKLKKNKDGSVSGVVPFRPYTFELTGPPNGIYAYTLTLNAIGFESKLVVTDSKNKQIATKKAAKGKVCQVSFVPPAQGRYSIQVWGKGVPQTGGRYRLIINEEITR